LASSKIRILRPQLFKTSRPSKTKTALAKTSKNGLKTKRSRPVLRTTSLIRPREFGSGPQLEKCSATTRRHAMVRQKYFKGEQTYTKNNKINNSSENFRGAILLLVGGHSSPYPPWLRPGKRLLISITFHDNNVFDWFLSLQSHTLRFTILKVTAIISFKLTSASKSLAAQTKTNAKKDAML